MKGVSVIIACYKAGDYLREAVESVHAVRPQIPYEIIIVDDGSQDRATTIALNALHITDCKVKIVESPFNRGQSAARNQAMMLAKYDYIFPMDADDLMDPSAPGYMDQAVNHLEKNPDCLLSYCRSIMFGAHDGPFLLPKYSEKTMLVDNMIPVFGIFRREDALAIGGYKEDLRYTEDWELWLAMHNARFLKDQPRHVGYTKTAHYLYRQHNHSNSVSSSQRLPIVEHMTALSQRSAELYEHYLGTSDPVKLASIRHDRNSLLRASFRRVIANSPSDVLSYAADWFERRYPAWKQEARDEKIQVSERQIS